MSPEQYAAVMAWLVDWERDFGITETHDGDCKGADAEFRSIVARHCNARKHSHPAKGLENWRANFAADVVHEPLPPLERNRVIVDSCDILLATPEGPETLRSGTWSTIRYAQKVDREVVIFGP
jgi:hypothetical protein